MGRPDLLLKLQSYSVRGTKKALNNTSTNLNIVTHHNFLFVLFSPSNNCMKDAVMLTAVTGLTSVYAATVTYTIIGFRATENYDTCMSE